MNRQKNIDKYIEKIVLNVLNLRTYLNTFINWYNNDWVKFVNDNTEKYKEDFQYSVNNLIFYTDWILNYIFYPKKYEYCVYLRTFFEILSDYCKYVNEENKTINEMWESSEYLQYYVHLIFKTAKYKRKIFNNNRILDELKEIKSYLSEPLHGNSIYYNKKYISKSILNKNINKIVELLFKFGIDKEVVKQAINIKVRGNKQNYLKYTKSLFFDEKEINKFLNFLKISFEKKFNDELKKEKDLKVNY